MRKIEVYVTTKTITIEVEDDDGDDGDAIAREAVFELIEWGWCEDGPAC